MASLADLPELVGFFSYSREDDAGSRGGLSALRDIIQLELSAQLGRSQSDFRIWQDKAAISLGTLWEKQIEQGIKQSVFFIPIVTPRALRSQNCGLEFQSFLAREKELGRDDLVFPILYIPVPALEDEKAWRQDPVLNIVGTRQYLDWRELRHHDPSSTEVRQRIERYCRNISSALHKQWVSLEERRQREETEARQRDEEEQRRKAAQIEAERRAEEERRRRADEEERARQAEEQARQRAAEERRRQKAAEEQRAKQEQAFASAKRAGTVAALDAFLAANPSTEFASEAQKLKAALSAREEAYARAMASDDPAVLRSFRDTYRKGDDVARIRTRLKLVAPQQETSSFFKPAMLIPAALGVILIVAGTAWFMTRSNSQNEQIAATAPSPFKPASMSVPPAVAAKPPPVAPPEVKTTVTAIAPAIAPTIPPASVAPPAPRPDEVAWSFVKDANDATTLRRFITQFPDSPLRKDAETRVAALAAEQAAWGLVKDVKDPDLLRRFIQEFPNSPDRASAEQRIASLAAVPPPPAPTAPDPHELARALQFELMRVGCFSGTVNGVFDDETKTAWHKFAKLTSLTMPDDATSDAINAVRAINKRVCPLVCPHGEHAEGDVCIANAPPPSPKRAAHSEPRPQHEAAPAVAPAPSAPGAPSQGCVIDRTAYAYSGVGPRACVH